MGSLVLCYAADDEKQARWLGEFLEANTSFDIVLGECMVRPDFDLVDAAERGLSAENALVLLSPHSVPKSWRREKWEPVFSEPALGFVLLRECRFPELLRRRSFFDLSGNALAGAREIRHWLLHPLEGRAPMVEGWEDLRASVADRPGVVTGVDAERVRAFATQCRLDFEKVYRLDLRGRSRAGIAGDIGYALGLSLPGSADENRDALRAHCRTHRYLFVFENANPEDCEFANPGGRCSAIFTEPARDTERAPLPLIGAAFFNAPRDEAQCMALLGDASDWMNEFLAEDFEAGLRLGWALVAVLKAAGRFAETVEVLAAMASASQERGDALALFKIQWEQSWLREDSGTDGGIRILPTAAPEIAQLSLTFD